jgi:hypothetical protein
VTKSVAKSYMAVTDKTKTVTTAIREDMRDAVEEARTEADRDMVALDAVPGIPEGEIDAEYVALHEETISTPVTVGNGSAEVEPAAEAKPRGSLFKSLAKSYVAVTEKTRSAAAGLREEVRDAIEEARYEREQAALRAQQTGAELEASVDAVAVETPEAPSPATVAVQAGEEQKTKRKYTKRAKVEAIAAVPEPPKARKSKTAAPVAAAPAVPETVAPKRGGRRKAAPQESPNRELIGEELVEVAEIIAEAAL